jgi:hypothetical protein
MLMIQKRWVMKKEYKVIDSYSYLVKLGYILRHTSIMPEMRLESKQWKHKNYTF